MHLPQKEGDRKLGTCIRAVSIVALVCCLPSSPSSSPFPRIPSHLHSEFCSPVTTNSAFVALDMSKLNANAFSFVPGQGFRAPQQGTAPSQPPPAPFERPPQSEAPPPPPTISLNIGGSKPAPPPTSQPAAPPSEAPKPAAPASSVPASVKSSAPAKSSSGSNSRSESPVPNAGSNKTFSLEKAKNDTAAIVREVQTLADESTLHDLFGTGTV